MKVADRDIVASGTVVTQSDDSIVDLTYVNLTYRLIFATRAPTSEQARVDSAIEGGRLDLKLYNFDNVLGVSWHGNIGKLNSGRELYLALMVHSIGEGDKITRSIGYTFSTRMP
jgi:hypothetical protein